MVRLSRQALRERPDLQLLIWPETLLPAVLGHEEAKVLIGSTLVMIGDMAEFVPPGYAPTVEMKNLAREINLGGTNASFLMGIGLSQLQVAADGKTVVHKDDYNTSLLVNPHGQVLGRYDKMHAVIFGEYMPLGDYLPWLYHLSPLRDGLCEGTQPASLELGGLRFCPSVCYESIMPQEVRGSVTPPAERRARAGRAREPDQ